MSETTQSEHNQSNSGRIGHLAGKELESVDYGGDVKVSGYRSIFSRYNLFKIGQGWDGTTATPFDESNWGISGERRTAFRNPSTNLLCANSLGAVEYEFSDFAYCSDFGKIPNHWMVTLRRFGSPVGDNIWTTDGFGKAPDVARAVGYMTSEKNKLEDLMGFSVKMNFKELKSEIQTVNDSSGYGSNLPGLGAAAKAFQPNGNEARRDAKNGNSNADNFDPISSNTNKIWGPIDVIDSINVRDRGLVSTMQYELTFDYTLKSIDGVNPRAAMMDLFTNLLLLTYNRGDFWGGATRFTGRKPPKLLGDPTMLQNGDFVGYASSMLSDALGAFDQLTGGKGLSVDGVVNMAKTIGGNALNMLGGKALDKMGRPDIIGINSLLKGDEVGEWHLTVGNPFYPTMVVGNLILEDSKFKFHGPMGVDGFPSNLTLVMTLKPAISRDRAGIQDMFSYGNGILKAPISPEIEKTYYANKKLSSGSGGHAKQNAIDINVESTSKFTEQLNRFADYFGDSQVDNKRNYNT